MQLVEHIIPGSLLRLNARTVDASHRTVQRIDHKRQLLVLCDTLAIGIQEFIDMALSLNLPDKYILSAEPVDILLQSSRHRIDRAETVFDLIADPRSTDPVLPAVIHQMIECHIIRNIAVCIRIGNLVLLRNARTDERKLVRDM